MELVRNSPPTEGSCLRHSTSVVGELLYKAAIALLECIAVISTAILRRHYGVVTMLTIQN